MRFSSLFVLSSVIASGLAAPLNNFVSVLDDVRYKVDNIASQIHAFPSKGGTYDEAIKLHESVELLQESLDQYTSDLHHYPKFNEAASDANMHAAGKLEESSEAALDAIVAKKEAFQHIHHGDQDVLSIITEDIESTASTAETFSNAIIEHTDATHVSEAKALRDRLGKKFECTVAALKST